jgi:hypothetical protein
MMEIDKILDAQRAWQTVSAEDDIAVSKIALDSLTKCADAISILCKNLKEIGYAWAGSERILANVLERNILTIEKKIGLPIPQLLVLFWEKVGGVSLVDLNNYQHVDFWKQHNVLAPKFYCDGLHIDACNEEWASFICSDFVDWREYYGADEPEGFLLSLSPDGYHKDNISGGAPYGVYPGASWKPIWQNFEWSGMKRPITAPASPPDFLSYLRTTILECAGFPAFLGVTAFGPIKERLFQDVPIF